MAIEVGNKFSSLSVTNELKQITKLVLVHKLLQVTLGQLHGIVLYWYILVADDILSFPYAKGFKDEK